MSERDYYLKKQKENRAKQEIATANENMQKIKKKDWKGRSEIIHDKLVGGLVKRGYTNNKN